MSFLERLLLTAWVGSHWAIGYIAAPVLFSMVDRRLAGDLAGEMFHIVYIVGLVVGLILLALSAFHSVRPVLRNWRLWALGAMVLLVAISFFWIQPMMAELKAAGLVEGSAERARFGMLHGVSSLLYLVVSVLGAVLVALGLRKPRSWA